MINRNFKSIALAAGLAAGLTVAASSVRASETGIVYKQSSEEVSYCHIKYMAMTNESLQRGVPEFNPSDIIDMYGPCNFDPQSHEEMRRQAAAMSRGQHGESGGDSSSSD
jgi:hypothetical protein